MTCVNWVIVTYHNIRAHVDNIRVIAGTQEEGLKGVDEFVLWSAVHWRTMNRVENDLRGRQRCPRHFPTP